MAASRSAVLALLGIALASCGPGAASLGPAEQPTGVAQVTLPPVTATPGVTPELFPHPPPSPTPKPTPKALPVPPKPTGLELSLACGWGPDGEGGCDTGTDGGFLTWQKPRTKGVEVRVYGVTKCFRTDAPNGPCLREHTLVPSKIRVLLAKGPASKGGLSFPQTLFAHTKEGCEYGYRSGDGTIFYSIVAAAYNASGHSIFAIADDGHYDSDECGIDTD